MDTITRACAVCLLLFVTAHRLPAPISEESPTPSPQHETKKPRAKETSPKQTSEGSTKSKAPSVTSKIQSTPNRPPFAGTWSGTLNWGIFGNFQHTIVIDAAQKTVTITNVESGSNFPASISGDTISWATGFFREHKWTLKPVADGKTALVTASGAGSAIFRNEN